MTNFKIHLPLVVLIIISISIISFALLVGGTIPYFLFYIFLLSFTLPFIHSLIVLINLKGSINLPKKSIFAGDNIDLNFKVENTTFLSIPHMEIVSNLSRELTGQSPNKLIISLDKGEDFNYKENLILRRRGYYELGKIEIIITDVFGFYSFKKILTEEISLLVYPKPISISSFQTIISKKPGQWYLDNSIFKDVNQIKTLRDYEEGDSIKSIHWKLSAKTDNLIIKEYENPGDNKLVLFLDNNMDLFKTDVNRRLEDKIVDIGLSLINYSLEENIKIELNTKNSTTPIKVEGQSISDLKPFLEVLARFKGNGSLDFISMVMESIHFLNQESTVIIITPNLNKKIGSLAIQLKTKNLNPILIGITDKENKNGFIDFQVKDFLDLENIPVYVLDYNRSIKEVLEVYHG